jgi:hypothetical protein
LTWQHSAPQRDAISKNHVTAIQPVTINLTWKLSYDFINILFGMKRYA